MVQYKYVAKNLQQEKFTGTFIAENEADLVVQLQKQGLFLISAKPYNGATPSAFFTLGTGGVKIGELNTFCRQFAIMLNSGISIIQSLDILKEQEYTAYFKEILAILDDDVRAGMMFSEALNKHEKVFPKFFRSMVSVGEKSGKMDTVLNSLADYYENEAKIKRKVKGALAYPLTLLVMTVGIIIIMFAFVIPTFRDSLSSLDVTPTGLTKAVYDLSDFILENGLYILAGAVVFALLIFVISKTKKGREGFDWLKVNFPIVSKITISTVTARFARSFGLLINSGMDMIDAMEAVTIVFDNVNIEKRFRAATEDVKHGITLSMAFEKYKLFPSILCQMVAVGERTNALDDVLSRSCSFFDEQVNSTIEGITSKIQPIMLIFMGGVVGVMFIAVYSPMLEIMTSLT